MTFHRVILLRRSRMTALKILTRMGSTMLLSAVMLCAFLLWSGLTAGLSPTWAIQHMVAREPAGTASQEASEAKDPWSELAGDIRLSYKAEAAYMKLEDLLLLEGVALTTLERRDLKILSYKGQQWFIMPSADGRLNLLDATGRETWHSAYREKGVDYIETDFLKAVDHGDLGALLAEKADWFGNVYGVTTVLASRETPPSLAADLETLPRGIPVLCYHHLLAEAEMTPAQKANPAIVSAEKFERDLAYLKAKGVTTLTMAQLQAHLEGRWTAPENSVVITFDDGYKSGYRYAYPLLKKYGFTASMFVVTGTVEAQPVAWDPAVTVKISWQEMNKAKNVFEYHPHSHQLHEVNGAGVPLALALGEKALAADLKTATVLLEDWGFNRVKVYAHPYGAHDAKMDRVLAGAGYAMAFALGNEPARITDPIFGLKRYGVFPYTGPGSFDRMLRQ